MRSIFLFITLLISFFLFTSSLKAREKWILDKELSTINFKLAILFANNVFGEFKKIESLIEIDTQTRKQNKAIISVSLESLDMNYKKYKNLLLGNIFFDSKTYPIALIDTKKFSYVDEKKLNLNVELTIKGTTNTVPLELEINHLTEDLVQIKGLLYFSRTDFKIGTGNWSSTAILKDKAYITANLFLFKE